jgi:hypothetical protein
VCTIPTVTARALPFRPRAERASHVPEAIDVSARNKLKAAEAEFVAAAAAAATAAASVSLAAA